MAVPVLTAASPDVGWLVAASAANMAGWHDLHLRSLGHTTAWRDGLWLTPDRVPVIFFSAIAVRPGASAAALGAGTTAGAWTAASDPWSDMELEALGYQHLADQPWMARPPARLGSAEDPVLSSPAGLTIERVADEAGLLLFERVAAEGFGSDPVAPNTWAGPQVLADPRLEMWLGSLDGRPAGAAMSFAHAGVLGVYGVATVPPMRRRGVATALMAHIVTRHPETTAVLQPSRMAEPMYRRLGFRRFAAFRSWTRVGEDR